ncbi:MAG: GFA family protein [Aliishimia sp.]
MANVKKLSGQCLCGAVTVEATASAPKLRACHCDMCRQHNSSMFLSIETDQESIAVSGPVATFQSSDWAQRAFCKICGSTLWYGTTSDGRRNLSAGLFPNAGDAEMTVEFFSDKCPSGYALKGDHKKLSTTETIALFAP